MNDKRLTSTQWIMRNLVALALAGVIFTSVSGCMLLAAGAAGAGAGYIAGDAADEDDD